MPGYRHFQKLQTRDLILASFEITVGFVCSLDVENVLAVSAFLLLPEVFLANVFEVTWDFGAVVNVIV